MNAPLKSPFPYFGGKSKVAREIWRRFGEPQNYIEPFFGSGATLLARPVFDARRHLETVNDLDGLLCNFWRAVKADPRGVAEVANHPVIETDLYARHCWLVANRPRITHALEADPDWFDVLAAGRWVWGISCWLGGSWCGGRVSRSRPHISGYGNGIHRQMRTTLFDYLAELSERLRRVRVCCGDWSRVVTPSATTGNGLTAVLLDPPYADAAQRADQLYAMDSLSVAHDVRAWALANGDNKQMRIALCGYEGEHTVPNDWECLPWTAGPGFSNRGRRCNQNRRRERVWFSPHCL